MPAPFRGHPVRAAAQTLRRLRAAGLELRLSWNNPSHNHTILVYTLRHRPSTHFFVPRVAHVGFRVYHIPPNKDRRGTKAPSNRIVVQVGGQTLLFVFEGRGFAGSLSKKQTTRSDTITATCSPPADGLGCVCPKPIHSPPDKEIYNVAHWYRSASENARDGGG